MAVIAVSAQESVVRIARLEGDCLREFWLWDRAAPDGVGDVYGGRISAVLPGLAGRFVELGGVSGFLPDSAGGKGLSEGDAVTVTVTRAAQAGKGVRLAVVAEPAKPGLLRRGPGPLLELAARLPQAEIVVDDYALIADLKADLPGRLRYGAAFDAVLEDEVAALREPSALLPRGAVMHVSVTAAATLIDIDSGSGTTPLPALNRAVLPELARQIVLRNLSGGILVDFAGMSVQARKRELAAPLAAALTDDWLKPSLLGFSHLGFAEISRRRIRPALAEVWT
jgi:Ribonuclease G/E